MSQSVPAPAMHFRKPRRSGAALEVSISCIACSSTGDADAPTGVVLPLHDHGRQPSIPAAARASRE
jgi:hypothetical protein